MVWVELMVMVFVFRFIVRMTAGSVMGGIGEGVGDERRRVGSFSLEKWGRRG